MVHPLGLRGRHRSRQRDPDADMSTSHC
jgi:hypothetical protein